MADLDECFCKVSWHDDTWVELHCSFGIGSVINMNAGHERVNSPERMRSLCWPVTDISRSIKDPSNFQLNIAISLQNYHQPGQFTVDRLDLWFYGIYLRHARMLSSIRYNSNERLVSTCCFFPVANGPMWVLPWLNEAHSSVSCNQGGSSWPSDLSLYPNVYSTDAGAWWGSNNVSHESVGYLPHEMILNG